MEEKKDPEGLLMFFPRHNQQVQSSNSSQKATKFSWKQVQKQSHKSNSCQVSNVSSLGKGTAFGLQAQPKLGLYYQAQTPPPGVQNLHHRLHKPEVLAAQGLQALSQGAVQAGLSPLPRRLEERGEEPPEQAQQERVSDQLGVDDAWVHRVGGDPRS